MTLQLKRVDGSGRLGDKFCAYKVAWIWTHVAADHTQKLVA